MLPNLQSVPVQPVSSAAAASVIVGMIESGEGASGMLPGGGTITELLQQWVNTLGGTASVRNMKRDAQLLYLLALMQRAQQA